MTAFFVKNASRQIFVQLVPQVKDVPYTVLFAAGAYIPAFLTKRYATLGADSFKELFPVILADNGSEFSDPKRIKFDEHGNRRSYIFYCNASAPYQKGSCEVHHEIIRRILPKGVDLTAYQQEQINLMMSHINSYRRKTLGNKSPYEMFSFQYGENLLKKIGLRKIPPDEIILSPRLFK